MLNPEKVDLFFKYLNERERVRIKKESGEPWPFTDDKILQNYKFTNVLRENDRTSRWFIKHWATPHKGLPLEVQLYNCGLFRYFGTIEFAQAVGYQTQGHNPAHIIKTASDMLSKGLKVFTGAYVITNGGITDNKENVVVNHYLDTLWRHATNIVEIAKKEQRWEPVAKYMMNLPGWGGSGFMVKECLSDAMFTDVLAICLDKNEWSPCGPGARRGLNWLHDREEDFKQKENAFLSEMKELFEMCESRFEEHMPKVREKFDLHAVQFALCEIYKYQKVMNNLGRPRSCYGKTRVNREGV